MEWAVVGHAQQKKYFERMMAADFLAHAYLFHGPQGVGKRMFAGELAAALLADGVMPLKSNPDFILLTPGVDKKTGKATEIPVDDIRAMKSWAYQRPMYGARKMVLIDDAEQMSDAAANTVLKVLEEPPLYLHFLLVSSRSGQLLETITSRCQDIAFRMLEDGEMKQVLADAKLDADDAQLVTVVAAGRPGTALRLVHDKMLPVVAKSIAAFEKIQVSGTTERIVFAKKVADDDRMQDVVSWWLAWTHARLNDARLPATKQTALLTVANGLLDLYAAASETKYNRRLAVEKFLLELPSSAQVWYVLCTMIEELIKERRGELEGIVAWLKTEAAAIRTGRANPDMVTDIVVDYMGTPLRIKEVAAVSTPDARSIVIQPWDKGALAAIEKAIRESPLQLSPVVDGVAVRLTVPSLTHERREEYKKLLGTKTEEARIRVRHIREELLKKVQTAVKEKKAREDDVHRAKERLQKLVDEYNGKLEEIARKKEAELMSV